MAHHLQQQDRLNPISRRKSSGDENLIPLINVVFLLLVFFMVAGQIRPQDGSDIQPPVADGVEGEAAVAVDVQIDRHNGIQLDGAVVTMAQLESALAGERYATAEYLLIKADKDVLAADLGVLLDGLRSSGIASIRLLTQKSGS